MGASGHVVLRCLGAAGTVTGSKHLLDIGDRRILVDCGLFQGLKELRQKNWEPLPIPASSIDTVVLTHAHIDHSGFLPRLVKDGFDGRIVATRATSDLAQVLLRDAGHLQEEEAKFHNKRGTSKHRPALPLYTAEDGIEAAERIEPHGYGEPIDLADGVRVVYRPAGHILGSATATFEIQGVGGRGERRPVDDPMRIVFSGDLGPRDAPLHEPATPAGPADVVVVESTYGDRLHGEHDLAEELAQAVHRAVARGGALIIPAFAVARTQTLIYLLAGLEREKRIPVLPVYLDSPMAIDATSIYQKHGAELRHEVQADLGSGRRALRTQNFHLAKTPDESKRINHLEGPMILISASGMITGGRILHHLTQRLDKPETTLLFAGYQALGTRGWRLQQGETKLRMFGRDVWVRAEIETLHGLSAHGDQADLMAWLHTVQGTPRRAFVVHGDEKPAATLAQKMRTELGWKVTVPEEDVAYTLA